MVHKVNVEDQHAQYPALIEVTSRVIEVYDPSLYADMWECAVFWENAINEDFDLAGDNVHVVVRRLW